MTKARNDHEIMMVEIVRASEAIQHRIRNLLKKYEITTHQYNILRILRGAKDAISVGETKNRMHYDTSDVSRLLDRLVKKGLVVSKLSRQNRRVKDILISSEGLEVLLKLDEEMEQYLDGFFADRLTLSEALLITEQMKKISSDDQ